MDKQNIIWPEVGEACRCCQKGILQEFTICPDRLHKINDKIYPIGECTKCKSLFLMPGNSWDVNEAYPSNSYYAYQDTTRVSMVHKVFSKYCFPNVPAGIQGEIVDIGCGTGFLVEYLSLKNKKVKGFEMNKLAVETAKQLGRNVEVGSWESFDVKQETVSVLIMNHVIEHLLQNPLGVFLKANKSLRMNGLWVIRTPSATSWGKSYFQKYWFPLDPPRHTLIYSLQGIMELANLSGFKINRVAYCGKMFELDKSAYLVKKEGFKRLSNILTYPGGKLISRLLAFTLNILRMGDCLEVTLEKTESIL